MNIAPRFALHRPPAYPAQPSATAASPVTTAPAATSPSAVQPHYVPGWMFSAATFGPATWAGALLGGMLRGRGAGAIGAVAATLVHNVLWAKGMGGGWKDMLPCLAPAAATAAGAGIGFAMAGPAGALVGALVPTVPHMLAAAAIIGVNALNAGRWAIDRLKRLFGGTPAPPDDASF